jgi:hypothetical protein
MLPFHQKRRTNLKPTPILLMKDGLQQSCMLVVGHLLHERGAALDQQCSGILPTAEPVAYLRRPGREYDLHAAPLPPRLGHSQEPFSFIDGMT